jgi:hypothetical protein
MSSVNPDPEGWIAAGVKRGDRIDAADLVREFDFKKEMR